MMSLSYSIYRYDVIMPLVFSTNHHFITLKLVVEYLLFTYNGYCGFPSCIENMYLIYTRVSQDELLACFKIC